MYTKEILVGAGLHRFAMCRLISPEDIERLEIMYNRFYDEVGRDKFRVYAQVTPEAICSYLNESGVS